MIAVEKFRDTVLATGRWNPDGGASLKTFFIGQCLFRFPNPYYRSWHTAITGRQQEAPDDLAGWKQADPTTRSPEHDLVQREDIARGLADLDDRTRAALLLLDQGFDQTEVAARMGTTRKAVEMIVRRHRARLDQPRRHPTRGQTPWRSILNGSRSSSNGLPSATPTPDALAPASPMPSPARSCTRVKTTANPTTGTYRTSSPSSVSGQFHRSRGTSTS